MYISGTLGYFSRAVWVIFFDILIFHLIHLFIEAYELEEVVS
jgi:hypothetical protein